MGLTTDPSDPRLKHGADTEPGPQNEVYLVLPDQKRAEFIRPLRRAYKHVGTAGPRFELRDLTEYERETYKGAGYVRFEPYPEIHRDSSATGRFWTQAQLDKVGRGCGFITTMGQALAETYAANPHFYGATYCVGCQLHLPVGPQGEFVWMDGDTEMQERVGT